MARQQPSISELVRQRVRDLREERGLTQEQLCERAGVSSDAISRIEGGSRVPTLDTLQRLADAFGVAPASFLEGASARARSKAPSPVRRIVALLETEPPDVQELAERIIAAIVHHRRRNA